MKIFGILNITDDSFSDGGLYRSLDQAKKKADELIRDGADVIDLGAQSSNIHSTQISEEEEWRRLEPMIDYLQKNKFPISIDTYKPEVISRSLDREVEYINNINGFVNPDSLLVLKSKVNQINKIIIMFSHSHSERAEGSSNLKKETIVSEVKSFFRSKKLELNQLGILDSQIVCDPGMGFFLGDDPELSFEVLRNISELQNEFGEILVSVSRKSFLGNVLGNVPPIERGFASLSAEIYLVSRGIDFIRTHNVKALQNAELVWRKCNL